MNRSLSLFGGVLLATLPLAGLMTGCGGGGGLIGTPTATPTGTSIAPINLGAAPVSFGNGQTGTLNLTRTGNSISGTLVVNAAPVQMAGKSTRAFNFAIAAGTYNITGTVDPFATPITFNVTGNFPAPINGFSISGTLPTTTATGSYTVTAAGQTVSGVYPTIGGTNPTATVIPGGSPTPVPTVTLPPFGTGGTFNLTLTQTGNSNFGSSTFQPNAIASQRYSNGQINVGANSNVLPVSNSKTFALIITPGVALKAGDRLTLGRTSSGVRASIVVGAFAGNNVLSWNTSGGTLTITAISSSSISATLTGATLEPTPGTSSTGTLTFNGSLQANLGGSP